MRAIVISNYDNSINIIFCKNDSSILLNFEYSKVSEFE